MRLLPDSPAERGVTSVLVVGAFLALLLVVGMSVDFGIFLRYRRAMQNACDSGALAGALNLRRDPAASAPTAERYATNDMRQNNIAWSSIQSVALDDNRQPTLTGPRRLWVEIQAEVPTYFLRLVRDTLHIAVDCEARLTPIILTEGLVPLGVNYAAWGTLYDPSVADSPCADDVAQGIPLDQREDRCRTFPITFAVSARDTPWGSGNTGLLSMNCFDCPSGGSSQWLENFLTGSDIAYCYDTAHSPEVMGYTMNGQACANVRTETGAHIGAVREGVEERCSAPEPPESLRRIIMMPLLNPAYIDGGNGNYTTEIWGFVAFQIDCSGTRITGANPTINGGFVSIVSAQAVGQETEFDTGVYTIKLIE